MQALVYKRTILRMEGEIKGLRAEAQGLADRGQQLHRCQQELQQIAGSESLERAQAAKAQQLLEAYEGQDAACYMKLQQSKARH